MSGGQLSYWAAGDLVDGTPHAMDAPDEQPSLFDAVYVCTKNRPKMITRLLSYPWQQHSAKTFVLCSERRCLPNSIPPSVTSIIVHNTRFEDFYAAAGTHENFDLGLKRRYAIHHAQRIGCQKILLVDDDIIVDSFTRQIAATYRMLAKYSVVASPSINFPDLSVSGHLHLALGGSKTINPAGSWCAINLNRKPPYFCDLYNEDLLAFLPLRLEGELCIGPPTRQVAHQPFERIEKIAFQEVGEVVVDTMISRLREQTYSGTDQFIESIGQINWSDALEKRLQWWKQTLMHSDSNLLRGIALAGIDEAKTLSPCNVEEIVDQWVAALQEWKRSLWNRS